MNWIVKKVRIWITIYNQKMIGTLSHQNSIQVINRSLLFWPVPIQMNQDIVIRRMSTQLKENLMARGKNRISKSKSMLNIQAQLIISQIPKRKKASNGSMSLKRNTSKEILLATQWMPIWEQMIKLLPTISNNKLSKYSIGRKTIKRKSKNRWMLKSHSKPQTSSMETRISTLFKEQGSIKNKILLGINILKIEIQMLIIPKFRTPIAWILTIWTSFKI